MHFAAWPQFTIDPTVATDAVICFVNRYGCPQSRSGLREGGSEAASVTYWQVHDFKGSEKEDVDARNECGQTAAAGTRHGRACHGHLRLQWAEEEGHGPAFAGHDERKPTRWQP